MKDMICEAPKPTKRVRRLRSVLGADPELARLVDAVRTLARELNPQPYRLRGAVDVVIQEMREKKYKRELRGASCGGSSESEPAL